MKMFGHDNVADDHKLIALTHLFQDLKKQIAAVRATEKRMALVTTTSDEMEMSSTVIPFETPRHGRRIGDEISSCGEVGHAEDVMKNPHVSNTARRGVPSGLDVGHPPYPRL
ncbi:MAG TPA: hypothetical protein VLV47_01205, partial [Candidatus Bathyarchaeia archaeon]|nr:hypothetical protein [Candidatus Bathyarchaeia archaeon]